jgi:hypothetical protein
MAGLGTKRRSKLLKDNRFCMPFRDAKTNSHQLIARGRPCPAAARAVVVGGGNLRSSRAFPDRSSRDPPKSRCPGSAGPDGEMGVRVLAPADEADAFGARVMSGRGAWAGTGRSHAAPRIASQRTPLTAIRRRPGTHPSQAPVLRRERTTSRRRRHNFKARRACVQSDHPRRLESDRSRRWHIRDEG